MKKEQMNVALDPALKAKIRGMYKSDNCSTMKQSNFILAILKVRIPLISSHPL